MSKQTKPSKPRLGDFRQEQNRILLEGEKISTPKVFRYD